MKINISPKITIPLGIIMVIVSGLTYNYILSTIGGIVFILGLYDLNSLSNNRNNIKTPVIAKVSLAVSLLVALFLFWKFFS